MVDVQQIADQMDDDEDEFRDDYDIFTLIASTFPDTDLSLDYGRVAEIGLKNSYDEVMIDLPDKSEYQIDGIKQHWRGFTMEEIIVIGLVITIIRGQSGAISGVVHLKDRDRVLMDDDIIGFLDYQDIIVQYD